jgi:serine/threonine protein phosphatase PrpC
MPIGLAFDAFGVSETGPVRPANQDAVLIDRERALFVVADGMGGHAAGEVASRLAVDAIHEFICRSALQDDLAWPIGIDPDLSLAGNRLRTAIHLANGRVLDVATEQEACAGMGTTVVCALVNGGVLSVGHVGDSRLYLWRGGALTALTRDDTWAESIVAAGGDPRVAAEHPMRHVLTNVIGTKEPIVIHLDERPIAPDDVLLLCSDGVHGAIADARLAHLLNGHDDARALAAAIVTEALGTGATDNVTALVVRCLGDAADRAREART